MKEKQDKNPKSIKLNDELENYFRNTVIPQLFFDADLILRKFTPPAMKHFNLSLADVGRHINEISNNIRFPTIEENIQEVIESNQDLEKEIQTTDLRWYQMNILPYIIQKENRTNGVIVTFVDITDRIEILKGYERLNLKYENIIYSVSHDLRGPLTNIEGFIELLKDMPAKEAEDPKSIIDMLSLSVGYLRKTIEELTDISRNTSNSPEVMESVSFERIMEDVEFALKNHILKTDAEITTEFEVPAINFSRNDIRSIVYNLLSNAIKYRAADRAPKILIKTERLNEYILLSVKDNGLGIEEDKKDMIFLRYTRISNDVEGTGVGLFIVKRMVENSGGRIEVESEREKGATFKLYLRG